MGSSPPVPPIPPPGKPVPQKPTPCSTAPTGDDGKPGDRFRLCGPIDGGSRWWEINDMAKGYAVVTIAADFSGAENIARLAFSKVRDL